MQEKQKLWKVRMAWTALVGVDRESEWSLWSKL
jgi:hypothetical protein